MKDKPSAFCAKLNALSSAWEEFESVAWGHYGERGRLDDELKLLREIVFYYWQSRVAGSARADAEDALERYMKAFPDWKERR